MVKRGPCDSSTTCIKLVTIYRSHAKITPQLKNYMKALSSDIKVGMQKHKERILRYNFNPLSVKMKDGNLSLFKCNKLYYYYHFFFDSRAEIF